MPFDPLYDDVKRVLDVFSLEEVIEQNDLTVEELLVLLVEGGVLKLPDIEAL